MSGAARQVVARALAGRADRDPLKKSKDALQAGVVEQLLAEYLLHSR